MNTDPNSTNYDREVYRPPNPIVGFFLVLLGMIVLTLFVAGLIANWHLFTTASSALIQVLVFLAVVSVPGAIISIGIYRVYLAVLSAHHAKEQLLATQDARRRANEEHEMRMHLARTRLPANEQGNRDFIYDEDSDRVIEVRSGNFVQNVPHTYSPRWESKTMVSEEDRQAHNLLAGPKVAAPTIESIVAQLPSNELMTAYGVTLTSGKLITASIPDAVHFKLVGGSGFGKSCEAAALMRIATLCNDADHLQIALLDLEHKTSKLFEHLPHVTEIKMGRKLVDMAMEGPSADEVAYKLGALVYELQRRAARNVETPILLIYVEEMLSLQYEVDDSLLATMLDNLAILAVRGRKYGMFLEACTQADYSTQQLKVAQKQFRSRIAFAIDPTAARASGFTNTELVKQNFQTGQPGQFVLEKPGFSELMLAPALDVKQELKRLEMGTSPRQKATSNPAEVAPQPPAQRPPLRVVDSYGTRGGKRAEVGNEESGTARSDEPLSEKAQAIASLLRQRKGQNEIIQELWGVSGGRAYQAALEEYREIVAQLLERGA